MEGMSSYLSFGKDTYFATKFGLACKFIKFLLYNLPICVVKLINILGFWHSHNLKAYDSGVECLHTVFAVLAPLTK